MNSKCLAGDKADGREIADLRGCRVGAHPRTGDSDLVGLPGWRVKVKHHARFARPLPAGWCAQTVNQAEQICGLPLLLYRADLDAWRAVWPLSANLSMQSTSMWCGYEWTAEGALPAWAAAFRETLTTTLKESTP